MTGPWFGKFAIEFVENSKQSELPSEEGNDLYREKLVTQETRGESGIHSGILLEVRGITDNHFGQGITWLGLVARYQIFFYFSVLITLILLQSYFSIFFLSTVNHHIVKTIMTVLQVKLLDHETNAYMHMEA